MEEKACIICLFWLVYQAFSPKFPVHYLCIKVTQLFVYSNHAFQVLPHRDCWCYSNKFVILLKIYPFPKRRVTLYFTGYSSSRNQAEHVELLHFLKYVNYSCILVSFHKLHRQAPIRFSEKTRQRIALFRTTKHECSAYFRSHFESQG